MSESAARSRLDRLKDWYWLVGVVCCLAGFIGGVFVRFNVYYLGEQASITTLQALSTNALATAARLVSIDNTLTAQHYSDQTVTNALKELAEHVHELDGRADGDRSRISDALAQQTKNSESILLLLQPKAPKK